ncbi:hypothetical protein TNCV_4268281 [Trichonephila clavipes]|nr:hypothetical protein TNCV_4268281 [Trichonephila clavipes]
MHHYIHHHSVRRSGDHQPESRQMSEMAQCRQNYLMECHPLLLRLKRETPTATTSRTLASHSNVIESPHAGNENTNTLLAGTSVPVGSPLATDNVVSPTNMVEAVDSSSPANSSVNELEGQVDMDDRDIASPGTTVNDGEQPSQTLNAPSVVEG